METTEGLSVNNISVNIDNNWILSEINFHIGLGEILSLIGPSGCGKTTLLRAIAGLQKHEGTIIWNQKNLVDIPTHKRNFGMVFQERSLFPHLNVAKNIEFGLKFKGLSSSERSKRITNLLKLVGLVNFENRLISSLSGGEAQRVNLASALASNPELLMLDEPFSGLDRPIKDQLLKDIPKILDELGQTAIVVTHDIEEAFILSNRIAVMEKGGISQIGECEDLYQKPKNIFVAQFLGLNNILSGKIELEERPSNKLTSNNSLLRQISTCLGKFPYTGNSSAGSLGWILIHPQNINLHQRNLNRLIPENTNPIKSFDGTIEEISFRGMNYTVIVNKSTVPIGTGKKVYEIVKKIDILSLEKKRQLTIPLIKEIM